MCGRLVRCVWVLLFECVSDMLVFSGASLALTSLFLIDGLAL